MHPEAVRTVYRSFVKRARTTGPGGVRLAANCEPPALRECIDDLKGIPRAVHAWVSHVRGNVIDRFFGALDTRDEVRAQAAEHKPGRWERQTLIVMPSPMVVSGAGQVSGLGEWMKGHISSRFNMARFLLLSPNEKGIYDDAELRFLARCAYLTGDAWSSDPKYRALKGDFDRDVRDRLKARYDRFAVLKTWDFPNPVNCRFEVERVGAQGGEIPAKVEEKLIKDLFDPAEFQKLVVSYATNSEIVGKLLDDLAEAPAPGKAAMIYLGETQTYEEVLKVAARGKIELNVNGTWVARQPEHTDDAAALRYIRSKAWRSGNEMRNVQLALPGSASGSTVTGAGGTTTTPGTGAGTQPVTGGAGPPGGLFPGGGGQPTGGGTGVVTPPPGGSQPVVVP